MPSEEKLPRKDIVLQNYLYYTILYYTISCLLLAIEVEFMNKIFGEYWVGTIIVIIIEFIIALYFYLKAKEKCDPVYQYADYELFNNDCSTSFQGLEVYYREQKIDKLYKTVIFFWNKGRKSLKYSNVTKDGIKIHVKDGEIIAARISHSSRKENEFCIEISDDRSYAEIKFIYIDENDGIRFEILHTSVSNCPVIHGTIIGVKKGIRNLGVLSLSNKMMKNIEKKLYISRAIILILFAILIIISGILIGYDINANSIQIGVWRKLHDAFAILCSIASVIYFLFFGISKASFPRTVSKDNMKTRM